MTPRCRRTRGYGIAQAAMRDEAAWQRQPLERRRERETEHRRTEGTCKYMFRQCDDFISMLRYLSEHIWKPFHRCQHHPLFPRCQHTRHLAKPPAPPPRQEARGGASTPPARHVRGSCGARAGPRSKTGWRSCSTTLSCRPVIAPFPAVLVLAGACRRLVGRSLWGARLVLGSVRC